MSRGASFDRSVSSHARAFVSPVLILWASFCLGAAHADPAPGTLTLGEAYRSALRLSEQVMIANENVETADTLHTGALTIMGPTLTANTIATYQNAATGGLPAGQVQTGVQPPYLLRTSATLSIPLLRRAIFDARHATSLGIEGAEAALKRAKQQLMYDVATAFIGVLQGRQQVTIAQAAVRRAETQLKTSHEKVKIGFALPTAELLSQIELQRAQLSVNIAEGELRLRDSTFQRLVGIAPPPTLLLPAMSAGQMEDEATRRAREERADLRAQRLATLQAKATVSQLQSRIFWPTLDANLTAGYFILSTASGSPQDYRFPTYGVTGVLSVPLFQTGDEWIQVKLQRQRVAFSAYQESLLRRQIDDQIRQANIHLETAKRAIEIANEEQKTAQQNYTLVSEHYRLKVATLLEVVTAQAAVFEAETNKALSTYERENATYELLFAEGKIDL